MFRKSLISFRSMDWRKNPVSDWDRIVRPSVESVESCGGFFLEKREISSTPFLHLLASGKNLKILRPLLGNG